MVPALTVGTAGPTGPALPFGAGNLYTDTMTAWQDGPADQHKGEKMTSDLIQMTAIAFQLEDEIAHLREIIARRDAEIEALRREIEKMKG